MRGDLQWLSERAWKPLQPVRALRVVRPELVARWAARWEFVQRLEPQAGPGLILVLGAACCRTCRRSDWIPDCHYRNGGSARGASCVFQLNLSSSLRYFEGSMQVEGA